jgi:hypothetical protein
VIAALVACAFGTAGSLSDSAAAVRRSAKTNRVAARADGASLLARLRLPAEAARSSTEPAGDRSVLGRPGSEPATPNLVDDHGWWRVAESPSAVLDYIYVHVPRGSRQFLTGEGDLGPEYGEVGFQWPAISGVLNTRWLIIDAVRLANGSTALRADAEVVWVTPRPAWERIAPGARRLVVTVRRGVQILEEPSIIVAGRAIRRTVDLLNQLPAAQPGTFACPDDPGTRIQLAFYANGGTAPQATAVIDPGGCGTVELTLRGRPEPPLASGPLPGQRANASLIGLLDSTLGIRLDTGTGPALARWPTNVKSPLGDVRDHALGLFGPGRQRDLAVKTEPCSPGPYSKRGGAPGIRATAPVRVRLCAENWARSRPGTRSRARCRTRGGCSAR